MPTLVLKPYFEVPISKDQENIVLEFLQSNEFALTVNNVTITKGSFSYIKPGGYTEPDRSPPMDPSRQLKATNRSSAEQERAVKKKISEIREIIKNKGFKGLKKKPLEDKL